MFKHKETHNHTILVYATKEIRDWVIAKAKEFNMSYSEVLHKLAEQARDMDGALGLPKAVNKKAAKSAKKA